ncbi:MAG: universal stress protein [Rhodomicrobium sp.]|nr:universal stress protein [Rhodomicrobium sp.]
MRRFKNILVVHEQGRENDAMMQRVSHLARSNGARIAVAGVVEAPPGELARLYSALPGLRSYDAEFEVIEFCRKALEGVAQEFERQGIETSTCVLQGTAFIEIIKYVMHAGHDLVIKSAAGKDVGYRRLLTSLDMHLMRKCPCPVWIVQPQEQFQHKKIMAAVDPDPDDVQRDAVSRTVMDLATSLSEIDEAELHVVHAWRLYGENTMRSSAFLRTSEEQLGLLLNEQERSSREKLNGLLSSYPIIYKRSQVHMIKGNAADVLTTFARENDIDVIVMGTLSRSGIQGLLIGNAAETVLNEAACSVLAVKPPGFLSPVGK